ncbi:MAG: ATP-binding protein [Actinomycetota bacterium]|nr:ATP-binding protein [Actinomycetota bacterium]
MADAVGLPRHTFLLACLRGLYDREDTSGLREIERELLLLRVVDAHPLPDEGEMQRLRAEIAGDTTAEHRREPGRRRTPEQMLDALTENKVQTFGIRCAILGTFYDDPEAPSELLFGSDIDNITAYQRLMVYKPHSASLERLVSFVSRDAGRPPRERMELEIGQLRYASTRRRESIDAKRRFNVPVKVDIADFVAHKTAVFGMTRLGKSNTMKVIATSIYRYGKERNHKIGQLIFDPAGEYAEENPQDGTALAKLSDTDVVRYRFGARADELEAETNLRPLALNLFDETQIQSARDLVNHHALSENESQYVKAFIAAKVLDPPDPHDPSYHSERTHARRSRGLFYATLLKAGLKPNSQWRYDLPASQALATELASLAHPNGSSLAFVSTVVSARGSVKLDAAQLQTTCEAIAHHGVTAQPPATNVPSG